MRSALIASLLFAVACSPGSDEPVVEMRTVESAPLRTIPPDPAPSLEDFVQEVPLPLDPVVPETEEGEETGEEESEETEAKTREPVSIRLPFAPPIAMDPVDGQKVSITPETPTVEFKGLIYYFTNESNRRAFIQNPQGYISGELRDF